ncbi:MAG: DUF1579 family protein [Bdellovibrionota bacterium]
MNNLKKLKPFLGKWKTEGVIEKSPMGPSGKLKGKDSYSLIDNDEFILHTVEVKMAKKPVKNCEVISYDPKKKKFAMYAFENGQMQGLQHGILKGHDWQIDGNGIRFRGSFNKSFSRLSGEWQYKEKSSWKRWMTLTLTKK